MEEFPQVLSLEHRRIEAVVFDYGNTLFPFGKPEVARCDECLAALLDQMYGPADRAALAAVRDRDRRAPYAGSPPEYRENDLPEMTRALVEALYGREPSHSELNRLLRARFDAFVEVVRPVEDALEVLEKLAGRYRLALLSNYPDGAAIRESLRRCGFSRLFESVVVSADIGYVKPHPLPFKVLLDELMMAPGRAVYVGDNWLADMKGGKRAGMQTIYSVQWENPEGFIPGDGDPQADAVIARLSHLLEIL